MATSGKLNKFSFNSRTTSYHPDNAYWLAFLADCVYEGKSHNKKILQELGFDRFAWHSSGTTQCFVTSNSKVILIAFRGTEPTRIEDIATDLNALQSKGFGGKVHEGFLEASKKVDGEVLASVNQQRDRKQTVWITGHSLGGALAVLCASYLHDNGIDVNGIYTLGQPRVGNSTFCNKYNKVFGERTFRFANVDDIVPEVPLKNLRYKGFSLHYRDLGTKVWVTRDNVLVMKYVRSNSAINKALSAAKVVSAHASEGYRDVLLANRKLNPLTADVQVIREQKIYKMNDLDDDALELLSERGNAAAQSVKDAKMAAHQAASDTVKQTGEKVKKLFER